MSEIKRYPDTRRQIVIKQMWEYIAKPEIDDMFMDYQRLLSSYFPHYCAGEFDDRADAVYEKMKEVFMEIGEFPDD